jgi:tetratricopeptide (TPR) repeat protein
MAENPRIEELRRRVHADPASIAFAALAEEFRRVGRYEEAIETCRNGLQRHPAYLSARVTLGRALIETGDYDGAREELDTVLRSAPENLAAIRGLATIQERLGHSSEMDPHLADIMKTMQAEAARVPVKPPPPPEPPAPEPVAVASLEAPPELERQTPNLEPGIPSFDLEPSQPAPEPEFDAETPPHAQPEIDANPWGEAAARTEPALDLSLAPPLGVSPAPDPDLAMMLETDAVDPASAIDPEVMATVARLERFLGAIQSLRA